MRHEINIYDKEISDIYKLFNYSTILFIFLRFHLLCMSISLQKNSMKFGCENEDETLFRDLMLKIIMLSLKI